VQQAEEQVDCRMDHYQTPHQVHASVYAKKVDKERSTVKLESTQVCRACIVTFPYINILPFITPLQITFDLYLPDRKRFSKTVQLFGNIDPEQSSFKILGTKVSLVYL
jgi:hypothetical protein